MIGILAPLGAERSSARPLAAAGCRVVCSGTGAERARRGVDALVAAGCDRLIVWGCAGGLDPSLAAGDLLLPEAVVGTEGASEAFDPAWRASIASALGGRVRPGRSMLAGVAAPVAGVAEKRALFERTGAKAADMETAAAASRAAALRVPCAALRAVADPATRPLPGVVAAAAGGARPAVGTLRGLCLHPLQLPAVLALARDFAAARGRLSEAARVLAAAVAGRSLY